MKILALEKENPDTKSEVFTPHLRAEAARVWELYQRGQIREIYFSWRPKRSSINFGVH